MLVFLGSGQQLQIYAELLNDDLFCDENDLLIIYVDAEKVPRQNINWLPLPTQLWNALEFYQQNIQPILMQGCTGTIQSCCCALWVNAVCTLALSLSLSFCP